jgi:hypothetical protein
MVATVGGRRPAVSCEQVLAALRWRGVPEDTVSVHCFAPEDFLVVFESRELRDHVTAMPPVLVAGAPLSFRPWNRQAQAQMVPMRYKVALVLEGLPPHAWDTSVVEDVLAKSCAVDVVAPETKARSDMALFKLTAWTSDLEAIPVARILAVPEPVSAGGARAAPVRTAAAVVGAAGVDGDKIKTLQYRILVHLVRVEEDVPREQGRGLEEHGHGHGGPRESGRRDGDGGEGGRGGGPRRTSKEFAWQRGVSDQRRGPGGAALHGLARRSAAAAPAPERRMMLPAVASPAPLTVQTAWSGSCQKVWQVKAAKAVPADVASSGGPEREKASACKVLEEMQDGKRVVHDDKSPHVKKQHAEDKREKETLATGDVAEAGSHAPPVEQVVWADASDSLPGVEHDEAGTNRGQEGRHVRTSPGR